MKTSLRPLALASLLLLFASSCAIPTVDVIPRYGQFDLDGHFGIVDPDIAPGAPNVNDLATAGFGDDDGYFGGRVDLDIGSPMFTFSTQQTTHDGSGQITAEISSGGTIVAPGPVESKMDLGLHQFLMTFDFVPTDWVDAGLGLGVAVADVDARVSQGANSVDTDQTLPIPQIAGHVGVQLGDFEAVGLISGFELSSSGDEISFFDLDLLARYRLFGGDERLAGSIGLGWRTTSLGLDYEDDGDEIDVSMRFNGPYAAFVFSF